MSLLNRNPMVFIDGREGIENIPKSEIIFLKDFIAKGGILIDGDILLGKDENRLYYKNEFIVSKDVVHKLPDDIHNVTIGRNISKSFDDLLGAFSDSIIYCKKIGVYVRISIHESDKTFIEISEVFKHEKIEIAIIYNNRIMIWFGNFSKSLQVLVNHENKIEYLKKSYVFLFEPRVSIIFTYKNGHFNFDEDIPENGHCIINDKFIHGDINKIFVDNKEVFIKNLDICVFCITGPEKVINKKISSLSAIESCNVEIIYKTESGFVLNGVTTYNLEEKIFKCITKKCEYADEQSQYRQSIIKDVCIAFAPLQLPPYVLLEIIDWLPHIEYEKHFKKISLIISMRNSIRKIQEKRIKLDEI